MTTYGRVSHRIATLSFVHLHLQPVIQESAVTIFLPFLYKLLVRNSSLSSVIGRSVDGDSAPGGTMIEDEGIRSWWWVQLRPGRGRLGSSWSSECTGGTRGGDEGDEGGWIAAKR
jgi:hypothetical protein